MTGSPRIALVKLSSLGDVVHALPVAHALRRHWPHAELTWVVERREQAILVGNPDLDHVVPVDTRLWRREFRRPSGLRAVAVKIRGLARRLRAGRFDVAIDLQGLWKSGIITWLTRARQRVGFAAAYCREPGSAWFTNRRVVPSPEVAHVVDANLALLAALDLPPTLGRPPAFPLPTDTAAERAVQRWVEAEGLKADSPRVVLNPGAGLEPKRRPAAAFSRLGDELALRLGARVAVTWGPGEEHLARAVAGGMRGQALVAPPTSISELVALLRRATLVIGGDTGPIHLAAGLGVPTLGLFGPTRGARNGPYGTRTAFLQSPTGTMVGLAVEPVVAAAERLWR